MTEKVLSKEQTAKIGCLRRVLGVTLRDKELRSEICEAQDVKTLLESRDPSYVTSAMCPKCPWKDWRNKSFRSGPSPEFSSRGSKKQKGGHIFKIQYWIMQQPVGQTWNGGHRFQMGGPGTTGPPLAAARLQVTVYTDGKRPKVCSKTRWRDYISDPVWYRLGVEPAQLSEISVDRDVFRALLGPLSRDSPERKTGHENEWLMSL